MSIVEKHFSTSEDRSSTQSLTVSLPKLKEVISVSVNTGNVSYESVPGDDESIKITCRSGSWSNRELRYGYVSEDTKNVSNIYGGNSDRIGIWKWTGSSWDYSHTTWYPGSQDPPNRIWYEDGNGYEGWIQNTGTEVVFNDRDYDSPPSNPKVGDTYIKTRTITNYYYGGEIVKEGYSYSYYIYFYKYDITVKYKKSGVEMTLMIDNKMRAADNGWVMIDNQIREIDLLNFKKGQELKEGV